jgi:2-dehydropantoate 2-reductase
MRITVIGSGGVGGYFGGLLAMAGHDVTFVARGEHGRALRNSGLRVQSVHGNFSLPVQSVESAAKAGSADVVLCCVKSYDTRMAAAAIVPTLHDGSVVVSLQNGIENAALLAEAAGPERVLTGLVWVESSIASPGVIIQTSNVRRIALGPHDGLSMAPARVVCELLAASGADVELHEDIRPVLWDKLLFISSVSGVTCVTRSAFGAILDTPAAFDLLVSAMEEARWIANLNGVPLDETNVRAALDLCMNLGPAFKSSMLRDLERGRRLEVEALSGAVVRAAESVGADAPVHRFIASALSVVAGGVA